ncbi:MAG TPA: efflux RND transporter periplasmic adaptor subunit, partial [Planctomycetota bacterium]|nr:efflux RND transporter periplasmic adaptor subunit [Planctomycetota bacterium]
KGAVLVPAVAPQLSATGPYVYVVTPADTAEFRSIAVGQRQDDRVVIERGLKAGERVVTLGHIGITPDGKVKIEAPKPAPGEAAKP